MPHARPSPVITHSQYIEAQKHIMPTQAGQAHALYSGELKDQNLSSGFPHGLFERTDVNAGPPSTVVVWYGPDYTTLLAKDTAMYNSDLKGVLLRDKLLTRSGRQYSLDLTRAQSDPLSIFRPLARDDASRRECSLYDLYVQPLAEDDAYATASEFMFEATAGTNTPGQIFIAPEWAEITWWLEGYEHISFNAMKSQTEVSHTDELNDALIRERMRITFDMCRPQVQAWALEYLILESIRKLILYEDGITPFLDRPIFLAQKKILNELRLSRTYMSGMMSGLLPFTARHGDATVNVIPLPNCLRHFDQNGDVFDNTGTIRSLRRLRSQFSMWAALRAPFEAWCRDFHQRFDMPQENSTLWASFFPNNPNISSITYEPSSEKSKVFESRQVICTDGVYADAAISRPDERWVQYSDGRARQRLLINNYGPFPSGFLNPPESLVYTPPDTMLYSREFDSSHAPSLMRAAPPPNPWTPYEREEFDEVKFLNATGGIGPVSYSNLLVTTSTGTRPPQDGDQLYMSDYFLAQATGFNYKPSKVDIATYLILDHEGLPLRPSDKYRMRLFFAGLTPANNTNVLNDRDAQNALSLQLANFLDDDNAKRESYIWQIARWGISTGTSYSTGSSLDFTVRRNTIDV